MTPLFQSIAQFAAMFAIVNLAAYFLVAAIEKFLE
jgi:F0F1-type ATP synthase membrane subunit b/b'